jgi:hypothetical protein
MAAAQGFTDGNRTLAKPELCRGYGREVLPDNRFLTVAATDDATPRVTGHDKLLIFANNPTVISLLRVAYRRVADRIPSHDAIQYRHFC